MRIRGIVLTAASVVLSSGGLVGTAYAEESFENLASTAIPLSRADIEKYAGEVGLDVAKFKKTWDDPKIKEEVENDQKVANQVGATGTPTL